MKVDRKKILEKIAKEKTDRVKVSLYLSRQLYKDFKSKCGKGNVSQVMEELMRLFNESN